MNCQRIGHAGLTPSSSLFLPPSLLAQSQPLPVPLSTLSDIMASASRRRPFKSLSAPGPSREPINRDNTATIASLEPETSAQAHMPERMVTSTSRSAQRVTELWQGSPTSISTSVASEAESMGPFLEASQLEGACVRYAAGLLGG